MSTWSDRDSAAVTNWISKLPPRLDEHSATLLTTTSENLCTASASDYPPRSNPSLANSASTPESEDISTQSRKRKRDDIEQDHREQAQKKTHRQNRYPTAEHREKEYLVAAYPGTGQIEAGNTVADFQAKQFESRHLEEEYSGVGQSEPEYFAMDEDRASVAGSNPSLISNRPILEAKPPSRRSSRSTSPIRSTLALLRSAAPPIDICQPGPAAAASPGEAVNKLKGFLLDGYDKAFIPRQLEARLRKIAPDEAIVLHDAMFHDHHGYTIKELDSLWEDIQDICYEANACSNLLKDENAWVQVVRSVLRLAGLHALSKDLELNSVQSQSIESQYLPTLASSPTSLLKKADLALVISPPRHSDSQISQWRKQNPGVGLSHMSDAYTRETLLACPLEVKRQGGDYNEAVCQLAVWSAAALEKLRILASMGRDKEMLEGFPYPGWTVVGHEWQLHISWKEDFGKVIVFGPYQLLSAKVNSYLDIFRLLRLFSKLKQWLLEDYKSWVHEHVLGPRS